MTGKEFKHKYKYMGICSSDQEVIEYLEEENEKLKKELEKEKRINEYIKARFVICNTCTDEERKKCLMFTEGLCEGERCEQIVDLEALLDKATDKGTVR